MAGRKAAPVTMKTISFDDTPFSPKNPYHIPNYTGHTTGLRVGDYLVTLQDIDGAKGINRSKERLKETASHLVLRTKSAPAMVRPHTSSSHAPAGADRPSVGLCQIPLGGSCLHAWTEMR
jgi:hypothetical protein